MNPETLALLIRYEFTESLSNDDVLVMYQRLISNGDIWLLPPQYVAEAARLLNRGLIMTIPKGDKN